MGKYEQKRQQLLAELSTLRGKNIRNTDQRLADIQDAIDTWRKYGT